MKIYIVTSGCYSDYSIERVFLNKEKAEFFSSCCRDSNGVAEYDTDDNEIFVPFYNIAIEYNIWDNSFNFIWEKDHKDITREIFTRYNYYYYRRERIDIKRTIKKEFLSDNEKNEYEEKYKKVCYDLLAQIKYMKEVEGLDDKQINERIEGNTNEAF